MSVISSFSVSILETGNLQYPHEANHCYQSLFLPTSTSAFYLSAYCLSTYLYLCLSIYLIACLSACLSASLLLMDQMTNPGFVLLKSIVTYLGHCHEGLSPE